MVAPLLILRVTASSGGCRTAGCLSRAVLAGSGMDGDGDLSPPRRAAGIAVATHLTSGPLRWLRPSPRA